MITICTVTQKLKRYALVFSFKCPPKTTDGQRNIRNSQPRTLYHIPLSNTDFPWLLPPSIHVLSFHPIPFFEKTDRLLKPTSTVIPVRLLIHLQLFTAACVSPSAVLNSYIISLFSSFLPSGSGIPVRTVWEHAPASGAFPGRIHAYPGGVLPSADAYKPLSSP